MYYIWINVVKTEKGWYCNRGEQNLANRDQNIREFIELRIGEDVPR